ncbi:histidine--tRNA ligase [Bacteroidia bacterium]|nr:histidine--tRNA ligase [Bacteroidia bacterium]
MQKPAIPKGTRDFSPEEMAKRNYIFDTIREVYRLYGFQQIETPAMENLSTLMGKYGEEGDKLLFKILNSGNFFDGVFNNDEIVYFKDLGNKICEKGLRYDLTVPFARFVVMNRDKITFPFKRYQIQPVWRADRPQKGRYREFYQCDADIVGSDSLLNEVELIQIIDEVFNRLKVRVCIKINNRKILSGIAEVIGETERITDITVAIDKFEKIGLEKVNEELAAKGISAAAIEKLQPIILLQGNNAEKLAELKNILETSEIGQKGIAEIEYIFRYVEQLNVSSTVELDLTLARGLNYYTGAILEVKALDVQIGSITGGGRYDNLTGVFGLQGVSGVGISFGADRIYDVLNQLDLYPESAAAATQVLFVNFGEKETEYCLPILKDLRGRGISAEIYPESTKLKKQFSYADDKRIPFVAIAGENEILAGKITVKNMLTGEQKLVDKDNLF